MKSINRPPPSVTTGWQLLFWGWHAWINGSVCQSLKIVRFTPSKDQNVCDDNDADDENDILL